MKDIPKHFVSNNDKIGDCNFDLIKNQGNVYLYHRTNMDGSHRSYEVFIAKFIAKGTPLPGGAVEKEDRMQYPGAASFGKTAYDCKTLDHAEERYDELIVRAKELQDNRDEAAKTGKPMRRGRAARGNKPTVALPAKGKRFTMKMLIAEYNLPQPVLYPVVKQWLIDGTISIVDSIKAEGGKGRPSIVYAVA